METSEPSATEKLRPDFDRLADRWQMETVFLSSVHQIAHHPDYQQIIQMGEPALPLILERLRSGPETGHWFWALAMISRGDVAFGSDNTNDAKERWLKWGIESGYIQPEVSSQTEPPSIEGLDLERRIEG